MKKLLLLGIGILILFIISIFLRPAKSTPDSIETISRNEIESKPIAVLTPDDKPVLTQNNIPRDIHIAQVKITDYVEFALVQQPSMNVYMQNLPADFPTNFAGMLHWNGRDLKWEKVIKVEDINPDLSSRNNPVSIRFEGLPAGGLPERDNTPYVTVIDQNGASSGEGIAKVLKSNDWKNWELVECYYSSDGIKQTVLALSSPECQAVKVSIVR